jgi:ComF family protein
MKKLTVKLWNYFLDILFPPICFGCKKRLPQRDANSVLCGACQNSFQILSGFYCPVCRGRLPAAKKICHPKAKFILAAATSYENAVGRELIHALKYRQLKRAIEPFKEIINQYVERTIGNLFLTSPSWLIIPMPLFLQRERARGFNQAELISEIFLQVIRKKFFHQSLQATKPASFIFEKDNLLRIKNTVSQTEMENYAARAENIKGAFRLRYPERITGRNVILVDDVFTSGATLREAAEVLKAAGARRIIGFVVAKT